MKCNIFCKKDYIKNQKIFIIIAIINVILKISQMYIFICNFIAKIFENGKYICYNH